MNPNGARTSHEAIEIDPTELLRTYRIRDEDLTAVRRFGERVMPHQPKYLEHFYGRLRETAEFAQFFSKAETLDRVQRLQSEYWQDFFTAKIDREYVKRRQRLGHVHARIGLPLPAYHAAMSHSLLLWTEVLDIPDRWEGGDARVTMLAIAKQMNLDSAIVTETFSRYTNQIIAEQNQWLTAMSTPVTSIWDKILLVPLVGVLDSKRARDAMTTILRRVSETQSRVVVMDISGVPIVDTGVANHLMKISKATRLMGCECLISGLSATIAETIVDLGIDVNSLRTTANLRDALSTALGLVGYEVRSTRPQVG